MDELPDWITAGARFRLVHMHDSDPCPVPDGSTGVIDSVVAWPPGSCSLDGEVYPGPSWHLNVTWDPEVGRSLNIAWPIDTIEPLEP